MSEEVTLAQLAAEVAHLRRQLDSVNQRLDMIYGAVTRLADQSSSAAPSSSPPRKTSSKPGPNLSPETMLSPDSMLEALRQHAVNMGLDVSQETVDRLKSQTRSDASAGEGQTNSD